MIKIIKEYIKLLFLLIRFRVLGIQNKEYKGIFCLEWMNGRPEYDGFKRFKYEDKYVDIKWQAHICFGYARDNNWTKKDVSYLSVMIEYGNYFEAVNYFSAKMEGKTHEECLVELC